MRNLIILGTGRSGTSMAAALFRNVPGIFYGHDLLEATAGNPYGYYEDAVINNVNNVLVRQITGSWVLDWIPRRWYRQVGRCFFRPAHYIHGQLWLAAPKWRCKCRMNDELADIITRYTDRQPFCFKDPRFSVTLPLWRSRLPQGTRFLALFRDPDRTVDSMLRNVVDKQIDPALLSPRWAFRHWYRIYKRILDEYSLNGEWLLVSYDQVTNGQALAAIERFAQTPVDSSQINPSISRATSEPKYNFGIAEACRALFKQLQQRSAENVAVWLNRGPDDLDKQGSQ